MCENACLWIPLRDVEHMLRRGFVQPATIDRPQAAEDPEQRTFPAPIRPRDQQMHSLFYLR